jgi:hypothetical protein
MPETKQGASTFVRFDDERYVNDHQPIADDRECRTPGLIDLLCAISGEGSRKFEPERVPLIV